jgi:Fur family ferric uptake transcriptional regulator
MPNIKIEQKCIEKGLKMTGQRKLIAKVISESTDHPDVEEVFRRVSEMDNSIGIATVYRTIRLFEENGIVEKHDFGDGRARYEEATDDHHDHIINIKTGEIIEFFDSEIEKLQEKIAAKHGFKLIGHRMELYVVKKD